MVQIVLDRDSSQLTKLLIKRGLINKENLYEVMDYAISNKYLNVLAQMHKTKLAAETDRAERN